MRAITSATAAAVLGLDRKSLDNMLGRIECEELPRGRQGVERRVPVSLLPRLLLTAELSRRIGVPFREGFQLATAIERDGRSAVGYLMVSADLEPLRQEIDRRLEQAIETVVRRPRGRPRRG